MVLVCRTALCFSRVISRTSQQGNTFYFVNEFLEDFKEYFHGFFSFSSPSPPFSCTYFMFCSVFILHNLNFIIIFHAFFFQRSTTITASPVSYVPLHHPITLLPSFSPKHPSILFHIIFFFQPCVFFSPEMLLSPSSSYILSFRSIPSSTIPPSHPT